MVFEISLANLANKRITRIFLGQYEVDLITFESIRRGAKNPRRAHIAEHIMEILVNV